MESLKPLSVAAAHAMLALALSAGGPADGAPGQAFEILRAQDRRLAHIAYRIAVSNRDLCVRTAPLTGLVLHDLEQYALEARAEARRIFALGAGLGVSSVVPESPAEEAGIRANDEIVSANHVGLSELRKGRKPSARKSSAGLTAKIALLEEELKRGPVELKIRRGALLEKVILKPSTGCSSKLQLVPSRRLEAWADGEYVSVTTALVELSSSDDELAVLIAHEMAHNVLGHRARLVVAGVPADRSRTWGRNAAEVKATEIEADRFALRLMRGAGYRLPAAPAFWTRLARQEEPHLFQAETHPTLRERLRLIESASEELRREPQ